MVDDTTDATTGSSEAVPWSGIVVTLVTSIIQGFIFYIFFLSQRKKELVVKKSYDLYEPRQHQYAHKSPPPSDVSKYWWMEAWNVNDDELLRCVGLDTFMYLRILRMGARICFVGSLLAIVLIPVYATASDTGTAGDFNQWTIAPVGLDDSKSRLWITLVAWLIFINFILVELLSEWTNVYKKYRQQYMAMGGASHKNDMILTKEFRYTVRIDGIPESKIAKRSRGKPIFQDYMNHIFGPNQIEKIEMPLTIPEEINQLNQVRTKYVMALESAIAYTHAYPNKPRRTLRKHGDAIAFYETEIQRINNEIDYIRNFVLERKPLSSTAFVTFTTMQMKSIALQCDTNGGDPDTMIATSACSPTATIWENVHIPYNQQQKRKFVASIFWALGLLFWAIPVLFVTSIANLNGILLAMNLKPADTSTVWYGLVAGLLPVIALIVLMMVLYMSIVACATKFIRYKSISEVDAYTFYYHQLFQFVNLWLILMGGSVFNQINVILNDPASFVNIIAQALPGASTFFVNMIIVSTFGAFGLQLSMLPTYGVKLILSFVQPETMRTQRQLDANKVAPKIVWGKQLPPIIFIFLVSIMYMPIVPIMEVFALVYFAGMYIVWKHQCLHVYAQGESESGGVTTFQQVYSFLIACLYMSEFIFIAYMGIKEAPTQAGLGMIPVVITYLVQSELQRTTIGPLQHIPLEVAKDFDMQQQQQEQQQEIITKSTMANSSVFVQPILDITKDERGPMPYRRVPGEKVKHEQYPEL